MTKRSFTAPSMTELGTVATMTLGGADGSHLDGTFNTNTPRGELTFS